MTTKLLTKVLPLLKSPFDFNEAHKALRLNLVKYLSWGSHNFSIVSGTPTQCKGLIFKVNANHHRGYVLLTLEGDDTYTVHLISTHGNIKDTLEGIYFDELTNRIDEKIEKIGDYKY
jgi:predicted lipoprotein